MKIAFLCIISTFTFLGCSQDKTNHLITAENIPVISSWQALTSIKSSPSIQVVDQFGQPVKSAQVLIGQSQGSPFKNNLLTTDINGQILDIRDWKSIEHVTADATGFIRQTLLNQSPGTVTIKLNPAYLATQAVISGQVTQLPVVNGDKTIDFGLVMSALTRSDLLNFDLNSVISPLSDIMKVATYTFPVPSNVSLPTQKENYIFNLTIQKPVYRFLTPTLGTRRLFAAAGKFPFKPVVDELRAGKPFYEVINYFDLTGGGLRDVTSTSPATSIDIPGNELTFTSPVTINSPDLNPDEVFVVLTASEVGGYMIPTGLKKMLSNTTAQLNTLEKKPAFTMNVIKKQNEFMAQTPGADRLSAALLPYKVSAKPKMLPLVSDPAVIQSNGYKIKLPSISIVTGVYSLAVTAVISDVQVSGVAENQVTELIRQWEILGTKWPTQIQLPNWPLGGSSTKKRFEINYIGGLKNQSVDLGDQLVQAATHVTHSSTDF